MPEASNPAQELIDEEFPEVFRPYVPAALKRAYASADQAIDKIDFLGTPSARFQRGDLIVLAAEFEFLRLIKKGHLPFDPIWENYASPTGKHLVMHSPAAKITINQVDYPHKKPRWAKFRDEFGASNTEYLFPEWNREYREDKDKKHILLLHGHNDLRFTNLSVPHPTENKLIWWSDDLLKLPHEVGSPTEHARGEGPVESPEADLVEEVIKTVRDAG